jgi:hypothetical protein
VAVLVRAGLCGTDRHRLDHARLPR